MSSNHRLVRLWLVALLAGALTLTMGVQAVSGQTASTRWGVRYRLGSASFYDVSVANRDTAWIVGETRRWVDGKVQSRGWIAKTTDAGRSWTPQLAQSANTRFEKVDFLDATAGWATGDKPTPVVRTSDGGLNWLVCTEPPNLVGSIEGLAAVSASECWIVYRGCAAHTIDSGQSWMRIDLSGLLPTSGSKTTVYPTGVCFLDSLHGWVYGRRYDGSTNRGFLLRTIDGGRTWDSKMLADAGYGTEVQAVDFFDADRGWMATDKCFYRTVNSNIGLFWWTDHYWGSYGGPTDIKRLSPSVGFLAGNGFLSATSDGGKTWQGGTNEAGGAVAVDAVGTGSDYFVLAVGGTNTYGYVYAPTENSALTLSAPSSCPYGRVVLTGRMTARSGAIRPGKYVEVWANDGRGTKKIGAAPVDSTGVFKLTAAPEKKTEYLAQFREDSEYNFSVSNRVSVLPAAYLSPPTATSAPISKNTRVSFVTYLKPIHPAGSTPVSTYFQRYEKGKWVWRKTVWARAYDYSGYTRCLATLSLPGAGKWRVRVFHPRDVLNEATYSTWRYFSVR